MLSPGKASAASAIESILRTARCQRGSRPSHVSKQIYRHSHTNASTVTASASASTTSSISTSSSFITNSSHASSSKNSIKAITPRRCYTTTSSRPAQKLRKPEESASPSQDIRLTPKDSRAVGDVQNWLDRAFPGLRFPDELAIMMVTHESWDFGISAGHNRRLSFLGRRAMKFYLSLFLAVHDKTGAILSNERIDDLLMVWKLGDNVGRSLRLEEVMRWTPAISDGQKGPRETGLFKIRGVAVEALLGAVYHQHGAQAAKAFFSSRILPSLEGFTEKEAIELEPAIVSESRAGDAMLLRLAENAKGSAIGHAGGVQDAVTVSARPQFSESSVSARPQRPSEDVPSSKAAGALRRKASPLASKSMTIDESALRRQSQGSTSIA